MRIERRGWDGADARALAGELRSQGEARAASTAAAVARTIERVRAGGDRAVVELGERFDGVRVSALRIEERVLAEAPAAIDPELRSALERAARNVWAVASAQISPGRDPELTDGQSVSVSEVAVAAAAVYAPGGRSPYPSSVLMGVIPAICAGVGRVLVASPPGPDGLPARAVLAAACIAGAHEAYAMGGAQAIAALAYGTEAVAAVDVIAGPGSPWVQEAKLQCSRVVGIDGYAGPSELMVLCDGSAEPAWVALDLCAQAEHGDDGLLVAASPDPAVLDAVAGEVERLASARASVGDARVDLIEVPDLGSALALSEALAPEHLELACAEAQRLAAVTATAGCVFVGAHAGAAFGDYAAGSNHVLPTGGAGRFNGPLGPGTFRRRISRVGIGAAAATALAPTVEAIAAAEGFPVHGESARARATGPGQQAS